MISSLAKKQSSIRLDQPDKTRDAHSSANLWILSPFLDLMLGCGGLVLILFGIHYVALAGDLVGPAAQTLLTVSVLGVIFVSETHTAATIMVAYRNSQVRRRFSLYTQVLAPALVLLSVSAMFFTWLIPVMVKVYLLLVPHHFMAQTYGIALIYCMKRRYKLGSWERFSLKFLVHAVTLVAVLRQLTLKPTNSGTLFLQKVPFWGPLPDWVLAISQAVLVLSALLFCVLLIRHALQKDEIFPLPAQLTLITGASAFLLDPVALGVYWLYVSAFFHGTQYLLVVIAQHKKEREAALGPCSSRLINRSAIRLLALALLLSMTFYVALPRFLGYWGLDYFAVMAIVFVTVNLFHIITDGAIWRLRDPKLRANLVS